MVQRVKRNTVGGGSGHGGETGSGGTRVVTFCWESAGAKSSGHHLFHGSLEKLVGMNAHVVNDFESTLVFLIVSSQVELSSS